MKVAVIGGGLFGCTAAIHCARAGHDVHLFESSGDVMKGATAGSYNRLHRGYHYPRSKETGRESLSAEASFRQEYGKAIIDGGTQLYAIADGGLIDGPDYLYFLETMNLRYVRNVDHALIAGTEWIFEVEEPRIDPDALVEAVKDKLSSVKVHFEPMPRDIRDHVDAIVVASYAGSNDVLRELDLAPETYKFQVVEKPLVQLPADFHHTSIVVLDGPFCCLDPHGLTDAHVLGHVVETVHHSNVGYAADVPADLRPFVNHGLYRDFPQTRIKRVIEAMESHIPGVKAANYIGSTLTVRAVLPDQEKTDARPTLVQRLDSQVVRVFSGKMGTAVSAAREVVASLRAMEKLKAA